MPRRGKNTPWKNSQSKTPPNPMLTASQRPTAPVMRRIASRCGELSLHLAIVGSDQLHAQTVRLGVQPVIHIGQQQGFRLFEIPLLVQRDHLTPPSVEFRIGFSRRGNRPTSSSERCVWRIFGSTLA